MMSFGSSPAGSRPVTSIPSDGGRLPCHKVWVASTCSTSLVPIPNARAPKAPWVLVWLSPQTMVRPGSVSPELGTDDMNDALAAALDVMERDSELAAIGPQGLDLPARQRIANVELVLGGNIVIHRGHCQLGPAHPPAGQAEAVKRLGTGHLVNQVAIDVKQCGLGCRGDHVAIPYLLKQRFWHAQVTFT